MEDRIKIKPTIYKEQRVHLHDIKLIDGSNATVRDTERYKLLKSDEYNFFFDKVTGLFIRWGKGTNSAGRKLNKMEESLYIIWTASWALPITREEFSDMLDSEANINLSVPEILDWEISEKCDMGCAFCYKSNVAHSGGNVSFEKFKEIFHKLPKSITTIAFGIGSISLCPDLWNILNYTRENGIIPTITINGDATEEDLDNLAGVVGACAVSIYDKDKSYNCVKGLTDRGLQQCNIHFMISEETYDKALEVLNDIKTDARLEKVRALVMLSLKEKGRSVGRFHKLSQEKFDTLFQFAIDNQIGCGFDSCSASKAFDFVERNSQYDYMKTYIEPCESSVYSAYLNCGSSNEDNEPEYSPCSFAEGHADWKTGLRIKDDFMTDIWFNEKTVKFSEGVKKCRDCNVGCSIFDV